MGKLTKKPKKTFNGPKSRKLIRKEKRAEKKQRRNDYYVNRTKGEKFLLNQNTKGVQSKSSNAVQELPEKNNSSPKKSNKNKKPSLKNQNENGTSPKKVQFKQVDSFTEEVLRDKRKHQKLQKEMKKHRKIQLEEANREEDKVIKRLEKDLKLNKRKSKSIPKSFEADGLDYLLEMCDPEKMKNVVASEQQFTEGNDDFEEDFALISGKTKKGTTKEESGNSDESDGSDNEDPFFQSSKSKKKSKNKKGEMDFNEPKIKKKKFEVNSDSEEFNSDIDEEIMTESENSDYESSDNEISKPKNTGLTSKNNSKKPKNDIEMNSDNCESDFDSENGSETGSYLDSDSSTSSPQPKTTKKNKNLISKPHKNKPKNAQTDSDDSLDITAEQSECDSVDSNFKKDQNGAKNGPKMKESVKKTKVETNKTKKEQKSDGKSGNINKKNHTLKVDSTNLVTKPKGKNVEMTSDQDEEDFSGLENDFGGSEDEMNDFEDEKSDFEFDGSSRGVPEKSDGTWEDIYGRKRTSDGEILPTKQEKYIPPALRNQTDPKRSEKLLRLRKQCKGLLNRLAESNMHSISSQIEELYMSNSRNDMNETLTNIFFESLISVVHTPERLLLEHVMLIAILHANVGTEVGATFLLNVIKKFDELLKMEQEVENKQLDNTVHIIAQLYNFKVFHAQLLYQIIEKLTSKFEEKHVECILLVLKNVGFSLRKDDPVALKQIILDLQKRASGVSDDNARVKFMLDILLAIKNNNVTKIPNYDTSYSEHLKKLMKGFIRKGNYVTQLNISLEDLLKADERGKWWVVGSAWTGMDEKKLNAESNSKTVMPTYSKKLLDLAKKQRMNTDTRRNIFCIIMTAEDYLDAFEKLLHLGLKNQQEREIIHVILHCCLQEQKFNPYYAVLAQKFCDYDRRFQMTIRCSIWDKLKALTDCSGTQLSNMAKLLAHLFLQQSLPISTLKVIEFGELDKITLRFMRQVLLSILLHDDQESCLQVFSRVATTPKLKMFRDSLRLFIHHFLLKNLKEGMVEEEQRELLTTRSQMVEKALISSEYKSHLM